MPGRDLSMPDAASLPPHRLQIESSCHKLPPDLNMQQKRPSHMGKQKKETTSLYCGTTERIAKLAPVHGLNPKHDPVYLTDVYPGLLAFYASTSDQERFGILEIDLTHLDPANFLPCEWYLDATAREKAKSTREHNRRLESFRKNLDKYQSKWKDSLQKLGICVFAGFIPKKAIRRITIYDPASNPLVTEAIVSSTLSPSAYKKGYERFHAITRWLVGESVTIEEWLGDEIVQKTKDEKEALTESLQNKLGLDIFYMETPPKGS
jgi:hypothetical protein